MYQCPRCYYTTSRKSDLRNHFNRKKTCKPINQSIPLNILRKEINNYKVDCKRDIDKLNMYGKENTKYITKEYIKNKIKYGAYRLIPEILKLIYFNDYHPENKTIRITSEKSKYSDIFNGVRFIKYPKQELINDIIQKICILIQDAYECDLEKPLHFMRFEDKYNNNDFKTLNKIKSIIECNIMNNCI